MKGVARQETLTDLRGFATWGGFGNNPETAARYRCCLQLHNVLCLKPFGALGHREFDLVTFVERFESRCLNGRMVDKHIIPGSATDKPVALLAVKPLYCSLFLHFLFFPKNTALRAGDVFVLVFLYSRFRNDLPA